MFSVASLVTMHLEKSLGIKVFGVQTVCLLPHLLQLVLTALYTHTHIDINLSSFLCSFFYQSCKACSTHSSNSSINLDYNYIMLQSAAFFINLQDD